MSYGTLSIEFFTSFLPLDGSNSEDWDALGIKAIGESKEYIRATYLDVWLLDVCQGA